MTTYSGASQVCKRQTPSLRPIDSRKFQTWQSPSSPIQGYQRNYKVRVTIAKCPFATVDRGYVDAARADHGNWDGLPMSKSCKRGPDPRSKWLRLPRAFARDDSGVTAVEYGMIGLPFLAIIFATIQTAIVLMAEQELETATEQAARLVLTGQVVNNSLTQAQFNTTVCNQLTALFNCNNLMVNMQTASSFSAVSTAPPTLTFNANGQVSNSWSFQPGTAGSIVVLQVMYQWPVVGGLLGFNLANMSNGNRLMMATAVFKNEP